MTKQQNPYQSSNMPAYKEKPGANPLIILFVIIIFVFLPIGIFAYIATNSSDFFTKAKEYIVDIVKDDDEPEKPAETHRGLEQDESVSSIESLNQENPDRGTRTVGNTVSGYIEVPVDWTEYELSASYPLQSFAYESGTDAIYVTTLDSNYVTPDEAMTALEESLLEDPKIEEVSSVTINIIHADHYYFARSISYFDSGSGYYQRDFIFQNNNQQLIYVSIASPENTETLDYILESYKEEY